MKEDINMKIYIHNAYETTCISMKLLVLHLAVAF